MGCIEDALSSVVKDILAGKNYEQLLAFYRLWFDILQAYPKIPSDPIMVKIWNGIWRTNAENAASWDKLTHPAVPLALRLASDVESDHILAPHSPGLQSRLCKLFLREFFLDNMKVAPYGAAHTKRDMSEFNMEANLIAHWANLGCVEEAAIRNHILQSLIYHMKLHDHQADALYILFNVAGATFEAYAEPSVVDRCFELLKSHCHSDSGKGKLIQVSAFFVKGATLEFRQKSQEVIKLRERNWEGLPPPPVFTTGKQKPTHANEKDASATPVVTSLGLPNWNPSPQVLPPPSLESITTRGADADSGPPTIQSPSTSIATLSDFTIADISDDETPIDPAVTIPHDTFYLEDGNVEVLCGSTLFRVHTSVLSFHSPTLRQMFAQTTLAAAESPNGCPRILSADTAIDFGMLLKAVYLPGWAVLPPHSYVDHFSDSCSVDFPKGIKCQISPHSRPSSEPRQNTRCPPSDLRYSKSSVKHTQRPSRVLLLPSLLEKVFSADKLLIRTRFSTSLSSRSSHRHCRWRSTWQLEGG